MATLSGKLAASAPWRAGNSKMARVLERAHASLLGEGQGEGVRLLFFSISPLILSFSQWEKERLLQPSRMLASLVTV
jgi:hypothetical protein